MGRKSYALSSPLEYGRMVNQSAFDEILLKTGYWGDMTPTYRKGKASDAQRRLARTVRRAHGLAIGMIRPGVRGAKVHEAVEQFFASEGYETDREGPAPKGF